MQREMDVVESGDMVGVYNEIEQVWCGKCGRPPRNYDQSCLLCERI